MKFSIKYIAAVASMGLLFACKKDNFDPPSSSVTGRVVYNGEAIGLENYQVPFQLYQYGFGKVGAIDGTFTQEGNYATLLFNGEYKFIIPNNQGPFLWKKTSGGNPDTLIMNVNGSQQLDIEVTPYYMIRNAQISGSGTTVTGTFKAEKIITDANAKDIQEVALYINKTQFVSQADQVAKTTKTGAEISDLNNISLSVAVPAMVPTQSYVFARVAIRIAGVEDMILSPVVKIQL